MGPGPIEPNSLLPHWYAAQRALALRVRGLYSTKDTFVTLALGQPEVTPAWLETQTGVAYATLRRHSVKAMATEGARAAERLAAIAPPAFAFTPAGPPPWQFMDRAEKRP